ncbi:HWE histidine kinase domain-containing protein [Parvularcula sp. LCG005]|uniref:HWE histidine kinase domain-containing protein n=1 Tax=Parvularcula sp. LCG005 TaxID=3078805 RepID=UPI0029425F0D|nr:HWE histidine kinase domain-containing protein [Parvularcula sp. LCG005]WOI53375.1 HWE histidine kinase domain-containing protein [Parvularcula sp. LCG005]
MSGSPISSDGALQFLAGDNEMSRRIRDYDWTNHPLGPVEQWPEALRVSLGICLNSAFPTAIYWGDEHWLLYNDAWSTIPGPRHPDCLGERAEDVWPDIWSIIKPQFDQVLQEGRGLSLHDQMLPMARQGVPEETYWSYNFTPILRLNGQIGGIYNSGMETTAQVIGTRQMKLIVDLEAALGQASDTDDGQRRAMAELGEYLNVDSLLITTTQSGETHQVAMQRWTKDAGDALEPIVDAASRIQSVRQAIVAGQASAINDLAGLSATDQMLLGHTGSGHTTRSLLVVPRFIGDLMAGTVVVQSQSVRAWSEYDISAVKAAYERTMTWVDREESILRERSMMREIDHRARNALAVAQSVVRLTTADDVDTFHRKVEERIGALSRAHTLLSSERWTNISLHRLIGEELDRFSDTINATIQIDGPDVMLSPLYAQAVAIVIHELTSNAVHNGVLPYQGGELFLNWSVDSRQFVHLSWVEIMPGDHTPKSDTTSWALESALIERVVCSQLSGTIQHHQTETGFVCDIVLPLNEQVSELNVTVTQPEDVKHSDIPQVLIVEDEAIIAMDIEQMVADAGYGIYDVCGSLEEGLAAVARGRPDLAVLDANLAGKPSIEIAIKLAEMGVPLLFSTGYDRILNLPFDLKDTPILSKPVNERRLIQTLNQLAGDASPHLH